MARFVYASRGQPSSPTLTKWIADTSSNLERLQIPDSIAWMGTVHVYTIPSPSGDSSLNVEVDSVQAMSSLASNNVPSLDHTFETISSGTSSLRESRVQTSIQGSSLALARPCNSIDNPGSETTAAIYQCPFHFLECRHAFANRREWYNHSLYHFLGKEPPKTTHCPFPPCTQRAAEEGEGAWASMMEHLADHFQRGDRLTPDCRPDRILLSHLLRTKILSKEEYQRLVQDNGEMFPVTCVMNDPGRDRRDRRDGVPGPASSRPDRHDH